MSSASIATCAMHSARRAPYLELSDIASGVRFVNLELTGRVAVVTGGTSGIGFSTVGRLLDEGASVAFCARDAERVGRSKSNLRRPPARACWVSWPTCSIRRHWHACRDGRAALRPHRRARAQRRQSRMAGFDALSDADWTRNSN